jgi:3D (Asp-Asp-Asp) domain-containing protein
MLITNHFKRSYKVVVLLLLVFSSINFLGFAMPPKQVSVVVDGQTINLSTRALTVKGVLEEAGVVLQNADGYELLNRNKLEDGAQIEVIRAMPVKVWKTGKTTEYSIGRKTVREVLNALDVNYQDCKVYPALNSKVTPGMTINLMDKNSEVVTRTEAIPYSVEIRNNDNMPRGRRTVISPGKTGEALVTARVVSIGDHQFNREVGREVVSNPVAEVVEVGTGANMLETSRGFVRYKQVRQMEATAYTLAEGSGTGLTSIGIVPYHGIIAVDPSEIPYGTKVYIPGYGFAMAGDCGGAIVGNRIDLFMDSYSDAIQWGRRNVNMYILE